MTDEEKAEIKRRVADLLPTILQTGDFDEFCEKLLAEPKAVLAAAFERGDELGLSLAREQIRQLEDQAPLIYHVDKIERLFATEIVMLQMAVERLQRAVDIKDESPGP